MNAERLKPVEKVYHAVLEIAPDKRASFLKKNCRADADLRREVESLLSFENTFDSFLDTPPDSLAAEMFSEKENSDSIGRQINQYEILSLLGEGGMGAVYLAQDTRLDRQIALKILAPDFIGERERLRRFVREAKAASALNHPNIITIYEIGEFEDTHYIAAELIKGETLTKHFKTAPLKLKTVLDIFIQMASALEAAHSAGIVHRDIKPDNVMIRPDGLIKILDFGIVKLSEPPAPAGGLSPNNSNNKVKSSAAEDGSDQSEATSPGMIIGTANYMSPEQARGKTVDARSDIFSFGAVFYEMLAGKRAFAGETPMDTLAQILHKEPLPLNQLLPDLPDEIIQIVNKSLRKNPGERYQNITDVLTDLRGVKQRLDYEEVWRSFPPENERANTEERRTKLFDKTTDVTINDSLEAQTAIFSSVDSTIPDVLSPNNFLSNIRRRSVFLTALIICLLAAGGFFGYRYFTANKQIKSIAVLPFVNESGDASNEYLSDGLSDSLINKLSQLPQLKVIARTSSFKYKGKEMNVREIADALGVQAIVTGRVTKRGDDLQVSVEMIDAAENTQIWGEQYNRKVSDVLGVQQEIARTVSEKLLLKLTGAQERQIAKQATGNSEAYQLYLNGVFYRRCNGADNIRKAIEYQNQAIALDQNFAMAYAENALSYGALVEIGAINPADGKPKARAAAEKAVALDDTLPQAHQTLGYIENQDLNWREAEQNYQRAIELNPNFAGAHTLYAAYLSQLGRTDEALAEIKRAQELDPLRFGLLGNEGMILYRARRYAEAVSKMQDGLKPEPENAPARIYLGRAFTADGQYAKAIHEFQTANKTDGELTGALIYSGQAYALSGKRGEASEILDQLKTTKKYVSPAALAIFYAALGDKESAFKSLERAYAERDPQLQFLKVEPGYDSLREDPRFQEWLQKVGFPR